MQNFIKSALIYSGGPCVGRIATLFLLPFMTRYLTPADYGIIGVVALVPVFLTSILSLGFQTSLGKIYAEASSEQEKEGVIWTSFLALLINNCLWVFLALFFSSEIAFLLFGATLYNKLVILSLISAGVTAIRYPFEYYLRAQERSLRVFLLKFIEVTFSLSAVCAFVMYYQRGAQGYIEATCLSQTLYLALVFLH